MLDPHGFVASCNSKNFFMVSDGKVVTSTGRFNFMGITRQHVIECCRKIGVPVEERDFTLAETYNADEAFVTGTFGGATPVAMIDGHQISQGHLPGPITGKLAQVYQELIEADIVAGGHAT